MPSIPEVRVLAQQLADRQVESNDSILRILWFPHEEIIRLIVVDPECFPEDGGTVVPFYFGKTDETKLPCGIALVRPEEENTLQIPDDWGVTWEDGEVLFRSASAAA